jgi:hypothetical protein
MDEFNGMTLQLPASVIRAQRIEQIAEDKEARAAERERIDNADKRHQEALGTAQQLALMRGEDVSAMAMVTGEGLGRTISDVLQTAAAMADREDAMRAHRDQGPPEFLGFGDVVLARHVPVLSRRQLYVKKMLGLFMRDNPDADVVDRAMFMSAARKSWKP